ncbi:hypothetical protein O9X99_09045 [Agrobacterium salinitolerans]|nr:MULTISPECIES: hypothetical protein [Agrobacterium]MCZ7891819.1 hypothetical protein [Agrobacterium salinitolerans]
MITDISDIETQMTSRIKHTPQLHLREAFQIRPRKPDVIGQTKATAKA